MFCVGAVVIQGFKDSIEVAAIEAVVSGAETLNVPRCHVSSSV
jgi:hypothetical protein